MRRSLVSLLLLLVCAGCARQRMDTAEAEALIRRQIPVGTARETVIARLDSLRIEHSAYNEQERRILAIVRNTSGGAVVRGSLQVRMFFDPGGRLVRHEFREVFTGP